MQKRKYDTAVVLLYLIGKEDLLPAEFRKTIPYSTISSWRKTDYTSYIGHEFRHLFVEHSDYLELSRKYEASQRMLRGIAKAWLTIQDQFMLPVKETRTDKDFQRDLILAINHLKKETGINKALKIFGISRTLYNVWSEVAKKNCIGSHLSLCVKKYPRQLTNAEVEKIRKMLSSSSWEHWPIVSVAALALRKQNIIASLFSWYKYAKLFNIEHPSAKKNKKLSGLQSEKPNEYLHIDSTYYQMNEMQRACITFVMDNYSKMILGYAVAPQINFRVVKLALSNAIRIVALHPDQKHPFLVADGGKENHNKEINEFIRKLSGFQITKIRALKDIRFSNSPVEAIHKIMKGRYLRNARFDSIESLHRFLENAVYDYNELRPHYKHSPQTPAEVYFGKKPGFDVHQRIMKASKARVIKNRNNACLACRQVDKTCIATKFAFLKNSCSKT